LKREGWHGFKTKSLSRQFRTFSLTIPTLFADGSRAPIVSKNESKDMRAVVIASHGGVDEIGVQEVETPSAPAADRVRVRVHAAGLNRADILQRRGNYPAPPGYPQNIPGLEFAGEVEAIGNEVRRWKIGDRVFGITAGGAQAEFVIVPEATLRKFPRN
jgi:NADPH:quinone reductase